MTIRQIPERSAVSVRQLAPVNWRKTLEQDDTQQRLAADIFRRASLATLDVHPAIK